MIGATLWSNEPFQLFANQAQIDYDKIPDNYTITINGDTIYDYDITNPDTGDHGTVNYYITNNYTLPENGSKDDTKDDIRIRNGQRKCYGRR